LLRILAAGKACDCPDTRAVSGQERNAADGQKTRNPPGGSYFGRLQRWFDSQSPLWGFSCLTALDSAKIALRATHHNFETTSSSL